MAYEKAKEALERMIDPFFAQQEPHVFVVLCCDRVYVSPKEATGCRTCAKLPANHKITSKRDLEAPSPEFEKVLAYIEEQSIFEDKTET